MFPESHGGGRALAAELEQGAEAIAATLNAIMASAFVWTKTADEILASVARFCQRISGTGHEVLSTFREAAGGGTFCDPLRSRPCDELP